jgi:hypothetical protein
MFAHQPLFVCRPRARPPMKVRELKVEDALHYLDQVRCSEFTVVRFVC